jgi:hypothetical protein
MIHIVSAPNAIKKYKDLLLSEWKTGFPDAVLDLLWEVVSKHGIAEKENSLIQILDPKNASSFPTQFFRNVLASFSGAWKFVRLANLPDLPSDYEPPKRMTKDAWLACRLSTYLTLQALTTVEGDVAFLADVQALAFQAAIHVLLPGLRDKLPAEHSILLHSVTLYSVGYSVQDPAHCAYMVSQVYDYLNDKETRLDSLLAAFRFTSPKDHSYLTKAQEYWSELLDRGKFEDAEQFLFSLHLQSLPDQHEEVQEMIVKALRYIMRNEKRPRRATA